jgi:hypothetical protein
MTRLAAWLRQLRLPWQPGLVNPPKGTLVGRRRIATTHRAKTFMVSAAARTLCRASVEVVSLQSSGKCNDHLPLLRLRNCRKW